MCRYVGNLRARRCSGCCQHVDLAVRTLCLVKRKINDVGSVLVKGTMKGENHDERQPGITKYCQVCPALSSSQHFPKIPDRQARTPHKEKQRARSFFPGSNTGSGQAIASGVAGCTGADRYTAASVRSSAWDGNPADKILFHTLLRSVSCLATRHMRPRRWRREVRTCSHVFCGVTIFTLLT
jgi:hypothetical protein